MTEGAEVRMAAGGAAHVRGGRVRRGNRAVSLGQWGNRALGLGQRGNRAVRPRYQGNGAASPPTGRSESARRRALLRTLLFACALLPLLATVTTAAASPLNTPPATQAATLAAHLRAAPVYVTDQLPRAVPRSTAPEFVRLAKRTGVPTYVLVLPGGGSSSDSQALLGAVHDRLGRDGLFVLVDESSVVAAGGFGVRVPADDALTVQAYELPYDAGPLVGFERFVDVIAQGRAEAAKRAEAAREEYGGHGPYGEGYKEPAKMHVGPTDRRNQSFLTGIVLGALPLLVLLVVPYVRRWRWRWRRPPTGTRTSNGTRTRSSTGTRTGTGTGTGTGTDRSDANSRWFSPRRLRLRRHWIEATVAAALAALVAVTASAVFHQSTSNAAPPPTSADMTARVQRVADGLRRDPVYTDPDSPRPLTARQISELRSQVGEFRRGPVYVAVVPQLSEDESAGVPQTFADALHARLGKPGVYVVADPYVGGIDVVTYDVRIDANLAAFDVPDAISYAGSDDRSEDHRLGERLDKLLAFLDKAPRTDAPETSSYGEPAPDPVEESTLPRLFSGDFWPGLMLGAMGAGVVFALVAAGLGVPGVVRRVRRVRRVGRMRRSGRLVGVAAGSSAWVPTRPGSSFEAPVAPSLRYLRDTATEELAALADEFDPNAELPSALRTRVWDCLDTATLLADREGGGAASAGGSDGGGAFTAGSDGGGAFTAGSNGGRPYPGSPDGRVHDDVRPADLAAAITLARIGRAALATGDTSKPCCALNPLHGPATGWREAQYAPEDSRRRTLPVCASCRVFVTEEPGRAYSLRLTLPDPAGGRGAARVPYDETPGPLRAAARKGVPQLIRQVREYVGVQ
ncbi:hypothetical protein ACFYO9_05915 [Streptomyces sp. NPDC005863]|uniref:hypothetical protein n=1 Tax=unclassified Streptomyces TaxID=2593676 RepID=UPI0033E68127